jgi:hypothetical protein
MRDIETSDATPEAIEAIGPEQGGGPPFGSAWTLVVPDEDWEADLEHAAPVPRVGDRIAYIAEDGSRRRFVVAEVVHTVQPSASERPPVQAEADSPNATVSGADGTRVPTALRAGLPRIVVTPSSDEVV